MAPTRQINYAGTSSWKPGTAPTVECGQCGWHYELPNPRYVQPVSSECADAVFAEMRVILMQHRMEAHRNDYREQGGHA